MDFAQRDWQSVELQPGPLPDTCGGEATAKDSFRVVVVKAQQGMDVLDISRSMGNDQMLEKSLEGRIFSKLFFPPHWIADGVAKPNEAAKLGAFEVCKLLLKKYSLWPDRIASSIEGGVFISYTKKRDSVEKTLGVEVYNTSEVAALVNLDSEKRILYSEDIRDMHFEQVMKVFRD
jgi:hypothetical protein